MRKLALVLASAALVLSAGCESKKPEHKPPPGGPVVRTPDMAPALPVAKTPDTPPPPTVELKGKVLEKLDAGAYSYLRLQTAQGEVWAAVPHTATEVGGETEVTGGMLVEGFASQGLARRFDKIYFGRLGGMGAGATPEQIAAARAATGNPTLLPGLVPPAPEPAAKPSDKPAAKPVPPAPKP